MHLTVIDLPITIDAPPQGVRRRHSASERTFVYRTDRHSRQSQKARRGQHCKVLARGALNDCLVRLDDGSLLVTSSAALKKWRLPAAIRVGLTKTRNNVARLRGTKSPKAKAAKVITQAFDEALQVPGALAQVMRAMPENLERLRNPWLDAMSTPMLSPEEIARRIVPDDETEH